MVELYRGGEHTIVVDFSLMPVRDASGEVVFLLPTRGGNEWDREGGPLCDADGLAAFVTEVRAACPPNVRLVELEAHINDPAFSEAALAVVDGWIAGGRLPKA